MTDRIQHKIDIIELLSTISLTPRWLKVKAAAHYSGIGQKRLKQLASNGIIRGYSDPDSKRGDWIFDKESIDIYRLKPLNDIKIETQKTLDRMKRRA